MTLTFLSCHLVYHSWGLRWSGERADERLPGRMVSCRESFCVHILVSVGLMICTVVSETRVERSVEPFLFTVGLGL